MLNKLSYNLVNALNEAEKTQIKKKVFTESTYLNENEKLYLGRKAEVKRDVEDTDLHKGDIVTVDSVEVDVDGWDSDYVNVTRESDGKKFSGVSTYELNLLIEEGCGKEKLDEEIESEEQKTELEERLASLKTQLEIDGEQLADDEKTAIQQEIADIEAELDGQEIKNKMINESTYGTDVVSLLLSGDDVYFRDEDGQALLGHYANDYPEPEVYDEGYVTGWNRGENPEYDKEQDEKFKKAKEASDTREVWEFLIVDENTLKPTGDTYAYVYGEEELKDLLGALRQVKIIKKLEEDQIDDARQDSVEKGLLSEEDIEFKIGDIVKVPYKYGTYTPGEFTEAPIIEIEDNKYITVEVPSKQVVTIDQLKKWNTLGESEELTEEYSEKLGGHPEEFIKDVETIKATLESIDTESLNSFLARQMVMDWIDTCDSQISMTKSRYLGESEKLEEAKITDYINQRDFENKCKEIASGNIESFEYLDGNIVKINDILYKFIKNDNGEWEYYIIDKDGKALEEPKVFDGIDEPLREEDKEPTPRKMTKEEFVKKFGEGCNVDVINAGREPEERIEIIDEANVEVNAKADIPDEVVTGIAGTLLASEKSPIAEAEVSGLKEVKNQGNVYMLEDETNKFIVGENYNATEGLIENAEIYDNKEEADKDYLNRCEITGGQETKEENK